MLEKDWEFYGGDKPTADQRGVISFLYNINGRTQSMFNLFYHPEHLDQNIGRLSFYSKEKYKEFLSIIKLQSKLTDSKITDQGIIKYYTSSSVHYEIIISNPDDKTDVSLYTIVVSDL